MKKITFKIDYDEEKLKAIKVSLKEKNKDFDKELLNFIEGLYKKNVPKVLKKYIEGSLEEDNKQDKVKNENRENNIGNYENSLENNSNID
jgi:hypothetical protein